MSIYQLKYTKKAIKQLIKMDKSVSATIFAWIKNNLSNTENPRLHGKPLTGNHSGEWRYRIENYRIIAVIHDDVVTIEILQVGHHKDIYE